MPKLKTIITVIEEAGPHVVDRFRKQFAKEDVMESVRAGAINAAADTFGVDPTDIQVNFEIVEDES